VCSPDVAAWMGVRAISAEIPGWQPPHVSFRLSGWTVEVESDAGRMRCVPWQEAQLATVTSPALLFSQ